MAYSLAKKTKVRKTFKKLIKLRMLFLVLKTPVVFDRRLSIGGVGVIRQMRILTPPEADIKKPIGFCKKKI
jgi:hypothetical protein